MGWAGGPGAAQLLQHLCKGSAKVWVPLRPVPAAATALLPSVPYIIKPLTSAELLLTSSDLFGFTCISKINNVKYITNI